MGIAGPAPSAGSGSESRVTSRVTIFAAPPIGTAAGSPAVATVSPVPSSPTTAMALAPVWGSVSGGTSAAAVAAGSSATATSGSGPRSIAGP